MIAPAAPSTFVGLAMPGLGLAEHRGAPHARTALDMTKASATRSRARHSMPRRRASARNVSGSNQSFVALRREMLVQQRDLALERSLLDRLIEVGPSQVAVPLGDLVFEDQVIAEGIPGETRDFAMVLVGVIATMGEHDLRIEFLL